MAGFVQFDPDKWDAANPAKVAKLAVDADPSLAALAALAGSLSACVATLHKARPHAHVSLDRWATIVDDAVLLLAGNWVNQALELGWSELDLFGIAPPDGDPLSNGLAVWLDGRPLRALSGDFAVVVTDGGGRFYFNRPREPGARLLWDVTPSNVHPIKRKVG